MATPPNFLLGLSVAAALALITSGVWLLRQPGGNRTKAALMVVAGLVIAFNGWVNSLPIPPRPAPGSIPGATR